MYVIMCLKAKDNGKRYVDMSHYPCNTVDLNKATKFNCPENAEGYVNNGCKGELNTGDGWIMCAIEEVVTKSVKNLIGNWLDRI